MESTFWQVMNVWRLQNPLCQSIVLHRCKHLRRGGWSWGLTHVATQDGPTAFKFQRKRWSMPVDADELGQINNVNFAIVCVFCWRKGISCINLFFYVLLCGLVSQSSTTYPTGNHFPSLSALVGRKWVVSLRVTSMSQTWCTYPSRCAWPLNHHGWTVWLISKDTRQKKTYQFLCFSFLVLTTF